MAIENNERRLNLYADRIALQLWLIWKGQPSKLTSPTRLGKWAKNVAHMAYQLHPELREDGTLPRYFVAKAGRKMGFRGVDLTWFVEKAYETGMATQFIPEEVQQSQAVSPEGKI